MFLPVPTMGGFELVHHWHGVDMLIVLECCLLAALASSAIALVAGRKKRKGFALAAFLGALAFSTAAWAVNTKLSSLSASAAVSGTDIFYNVQSAGSGGVKTTATQLATFTTPTGSSGHTLPFLDGTNTFSGTQTFGTVVGSVNAQVGTTYTLAATDCGKTIVITNAAAITLTTLNSLSIGCSIAVEQGGAGQITVANGAGATLTSAHSYTKTFNAAGAIIGLFVDTNAGGTAAHFVLTGDGA